MPGKWSLTIYLTVFAGRRVAHWHERPISFVGRTAPCDSVDSDRLFRLSEAEITMLGALSAPRYGMLTDKKIGEAVQCDGAAFCRSPKVDQRRVSVLRLGLPRKYQVSTSISHNIVA